MKAARVTAMVTGDDDSCERISLGSRPIGFGYSKFRLTCDGLVAEQVVHLHCIIATDNPFSRPFPTSFLPTPY